MAALGIGRLGNWLGCWVGWATVVKLCCNDNVDEDGDTPAWLLAWVLGWVAGWAAGQARPPAYELDCSGSTLILRGH